MKIDYAPQFADGGLFECCDELCNFYKSPEKLAKNHASPKIIVCTTSHYSRILAKIDYIIKSQIARLVLSSAYGNMHFKATEAIKSALNRYQIIKN